MKKEIKDYLQNELLCLKSLALIKSCPLYKVVVSLFTCTVGIRGNMQIDETSEFKKKEIFFNLTTRVLQIHTTQ